jgi:molybdopterin-guanine dinucleotide biosynthesis protein A
MMGIVLSGGENRRMGGMDKAFLKVAGKPIIEHILKALRSVTDQVLIVTNNPQAYVSYEVRVVKDVLNKRGPLTGVYTGLYHSREEFNFVVACDMPFLNAGLISHMAKLAGEYDVVLPKVGEFVEPLHAVYRKGLLPLIEERIKQDARQIKKLFDEVRVRYVTEQEIDRFDPKRMSFKNLNTPEEYKEVVCSDLECRSC